MITRLQFFLIVLISINFLNFSILFSQESYSIGLKTGLNIATVKSDSEPLNKMEWRYGFSIGAFVTIPLTEKIGIQPELFYSQKGYHSDEDYDEVTSEMRLDLNYIELPILLTLKISDAVHVFFGPAYSLYLNGETETQIVRDGQVIFHEKENIESKYVENSDFSVVFGGSLTYDILILDLRYTFGFTNVSNFDQPLDFQNRVIQILFGISLSNLDI